MSTRRKPGTPATHPPPTNAWPKGKSPNPTGRPKNGESFASVLRKFLSMTGPELAGVCKDFQKEFIKLPFDVNMRSMIALKWIMSIMNDPTPGLLQQMIDRVDGPVPTKIEGNEDAPLTIKVVYVKRHGDNTTVAGTTPPATDGKE